MYTTNLLLSSYYSIHFVGVETMFILYTHCFGIGHFILLNKYYLSNDALQLQIS